MNKSWKKQRSNNNLTIIFFGIFLLTFFIGVFYLIFSRSERTNSLNIGEQQRQQVREAASQLLENILGNNSNFDQLTFSSDGAPRDIDDIEEVFLSGASQLTNSFSPEIIEQTWWELRPLIEVCLQDLNRDPLEAIREIIRSDIEKWAGKKSQEYIQVISSLNSFRDLFNKYWEIRDSELLSKISKKNELIAKGYFDRDIEQLWEWDLLNQEFPDLNSEKRIGVTNTLSVNVQESGYGSRRITGGDTGELMLFLKPHHRGRDYQVHFPPNKIKPSQQISAREIIKKMLQNSSLGGRICQNDIYILRLNSSQMKFTGPSSGLPYYLAFYSAIHKIPLPRNLGSTGAIEGNEVKGIGGLQHKLQAAINKKIDIFILSKENKKDRIPEQSYEDSSLDIKSKIRQVHFVSKVNQIEIALLEILKDSERKIVHSCDKSFPPENPEEEVITIEVCANPYLNLIISPMPTLFDYRNYWAFCQFGNYNEVILMINKAHPSLRMALCCDPNYSYILTVREVKQFYEPDDWLKLFPKRK